MGFYKIPHKQMLAIVCVAASMAFAKSAAPGLEVSYFGFENAVNRAGSTCTVFVRIINKGETTEGLKGIELSLPEGVSCVSEPEDTSIKILEPGKYEDFFWKVLAEESGFPRSGAGTDGSPPGEPASPAAVPSAVSNR